MMKVNKILKMPKVEILPGDSSIDATYIDDFN